MFDKKRQKSGQATIFIIIALVIVATVVFFIFMQKSIFAPQGNVLAIKSYLDSCFKEKAQETIIESARQGLYFNLPVASIDFLEEKTAYYLKDNENLVPSITTVEQELSSALDEKIVPCLALSQFRNEYDITWKNCLSKASLKDKTTEFSIECPITITKGVSTSTLKDFKVSIDYNVKKLINVSNFVVEDYKKKPGYICLECMDNIAKTNNVTIVAVPITKAVFEPEHIWFIIQDGKINNENVTLRFVTDYK